MPVGKPAQRKRNKVSTNKPYAIIGRNLRHESRFKYLQRISRQSFSLCHLSTPGRARRFATLEEATDICEMLNRVTETTITGRGYTWTVVEIQPTGEYRVTQ